MIIIKMDSRYIIPIPLAITLIIDFIFPFSFTLTCPDIWFAPSNYVCTIIYYAINILLGFTLKDANDIKNKDIIIFTSILFFFNLSWAISMKKNNKLTLTLLFITLLFSYFVYNEVFLSKLTQGENTLYLNFYSTLIIWLGFMITMVFEFFSNKINKNSFNLEKK